MKLGNSLCKHQSVIKVTWWNLKVISLRVDLLHYTGADANTVDLFGRTALINAASDGQEGTVDVLTKANCDVNKADREGYTPLMYAAKNGHKNCVELLVKAGAATNVIARKRKRHLIWL